MTIIEKLESTKIPLSSETNVSQMYMVNRTIDQCIAIIRDFKNGDMDAGGTIAAIEHECESPARSVKPAASQWYDYDPENPSDKLADGRWHLIEYKDNGSLWVGTSRYCDQRHWLDYDTAIVTRFARIWL